MGDDVFMITAISAAVLAALILLTMLDIAGVVNVNKWGWRNMSSKHSAFTILTWDPRNPASTSKVLNWLRNSPPRCEWSESGKDVVGFIQIGLQTPPHTVTHGNRYAWEKILFDVGGLHEGEEYMRAKNEER